MFDTILSKINLSKKLTYSIAGLIGVIVLGFLYLGFQETKKPPIVPEEILDQALANTLKADSFRFKLEYKTKSPKKEEVWSNIQGEKVGKDTIHIEGKMLKSPVEIFQIENKTYIKNSVGSWTILDENDIHQQELLVNEVNPLAVFQFKEIPEVKYKGTGKLNGEEYYIIEYLPNISNQFLEVLATDFSFQSWINPNTKLIGKTTVKALSKGAGKGDLLINLEFYDYGAEINLAPPTTN